MTVNKIAVAAIVARSNQVTSTNWTLKKLQAPSGVSLEKFSLGDTFEEPGKVALNKGLAKKEGNSIRLSAVQKGMRKDFALSKSELQALASEYL